MRKNQKYYVTLVIVSIIAIFFIFVLWSFADNSKISASCSINNIEYMDVSPNLCWAKGINETYCPMPHDISCSGEVSELGNLIFTILKEATIT